MKPRPPKGKMVRTGERTKPRAAPRSAPATSSKRPAPPTASERPLPARRAERSNAKAPAERVLGGDDQRTLLDVVDNLLNDGVVLTGELTLGLAGVDLVYLKLSAILCAADRLVPVKNRD